MGEKYDTMSNIYLITKDGKSVKIDKVEQFKVDEEQVQEFRKIKAIGFAYPRRSGKIKFLVNLFRNLLSG